MTDSGQPTSPARQEIEAFIARWRRSEAAERANYALFLVELCDVLGLPHPDPATGEAERDGYVFERAVVFHNHDGTTSKGFVDLYRRGCFVLETKQGCAAKQPTSLLAAAGLRTGPRRRGAGARGSPAWDAAMLAARGQAEQYAKALPEWPPFLVIIDVGHSIELYADFSGTGKHYAQFPDATGFRTYLADLARDDISARLKAIWLDPHSLDPSRKAAEATRDIAARLAILSRSLEQEGHNPERVATFLMRCLFTMFAEDVGLLQSDSFRALLGSLAGQASSFAPMMRSLWRDMDKGGFSPVLRTDILRFNGGLFADSDAIDLTEEQLALLIDAAGANWSAVEPAIFGTLLEHALDARERAQLGAHYTPRTYVERLVLPTLIEPLREALPDQFRLVRALLAGQGSPIAAAALASRFRRVRRERLTAVLDTLVSLGQARKTESGRYIA